MERESIDICPGWGLQDTADETSMPESERGPAAPSPLTVIFGGNGAGKSAIFDAVLFVLGQVILLLNFERSYCFSMRRRSWVFGEDELKADMGVRR